MFQPDFHGPDPSAPLAAMIVDGEASRLAEASLGDATRSVPVLDATEGGADEPAVARRIGTMPVDTDRAEPVDLDPDVAVRRALVAAFGG